MSNPKVVEKVEEFKPVDMKVSDDGNLDITCAGEKITIPVEKMTDVLSYLNKSYPLQVEALNFKAFNTEFEKLCIRYSMPKTVFFTVVSNGRVVGEGEKGLLANLTEVINNADTVKNGEPRKVNDL